uniref:NADH-ubiquinone oxidoreductase chain 2 n=1 Tax=Pacifastacus leniusculus TaxID=6720 RepID=A0A1L6V0K0_PACLE|nr:NADH dehydrogenase subunit 2 [Pacifastacus leniusculus]APS87298.1 NADH dehydrogenase subunit 2 [Pacifastacus leniusculus]
MISAFNLLFFFTLVLGLGLCISSNSWFGAWVGLELNLMSFIPLISSSNNLYSSESSLKYFLIQALASIMIIFSISFTLMMVNFILFFSLSLLLKLGAAPFHFWFPQVMEGLNWLQVMILLTIQKIGPMILLSYLMYDKYSITMVFISSVLSAFIGAVGGMNQTFLRKIMAFSSINHMSWMFFAMIVSEICWLIYFLIYCILSIMVVMSFYLHQAYHFSHLINSGVPTISKMFSMMSLLSLGGLPPFLGFIPKWIVIQEMIKFKFFYLLIIFLLMSLLTLYFYMRVGMTFLTLIFPFSSWSMKSYESGFYMPMVLSVNFFGLFIPSIYMMM